MSDRYAIAVEQATEALNAGRFEDALNEVLGVLALEPNHPDAILLQAIALSQLGRAQEASAAFVRAVTLAPGSAKARYNAAVHEYNVGNRDVALQLVNDALTIEPNHSSAKDLQRRIAGDVSYPKLETPSTPTVVPTGIPFIQKLGSVWIGAGFVLAFCNAASYLGQTAMMNGSKTYQELQTGQIKELGELTAKFSAITQEVPALVPLGMLDLFLRVALLVYLVLDLNHRKGNYVWLVPLILTGCCGFSWVVLPLYLVFAVLMKRN